VAIGHLQVADGIVVRIFGVFDQQKRCRKRSMVGSRQSLCRPVQCSATYADKRSQRSVVSEVAVVRMLIRRRTNRHPGVASTREHEVTWNF
jgi:hypothetical protein